MVNIYGVVNRQQLDEVRLKKTKLIYKARTEMSLGRVRSNEGGQNFVLNEGEGLCEKVRDVAQAFDESHVEM